MEMLLVLLVPFALLAGFAAGRLRDAHAGQIRKENAVMQCYMPHHGEVSPDCPVECLLTVLPGWSWSPLARAYDAPFDRRARWAT